jgi:hypothetical protein
MHATCTPYLYVCIIITNNARYRAAYMSYYQHICLSTYMHTNLQFIFALNRISYITNPYCDPSFLYSFNLYIF